MEIYKSNNIVYINTCKSCGKALRDEWNYCPFCKIKVEVINCCHCNCELRINWKYCPYCKKEQKEIDKQIHKVDRSNEWLRNILNLNGN